MAIGYTNQPLSAGITMYAFRYSDSQFVPEAGTVNALYQIFSLTDLAGDTVFQNPSEPFTGGLLCSPCNVFAPVPPAAPEPSTWAMVLLGFAGLGFLAGRRRRETKLV
jgi:hypothetical protein